MKYIERTANIAVIIAVAVFLTITVHSQFFQWKDVPTRPKLAPIGSTFTLPGVHYPAQRDSLVIGISTTCHFCQDSMPFYKKLTSELNGKVNVIAVLPQSQAEAEAFVKTAGLTSTQVVSANLSSIGINATPTLVLVDAKGKVKSTWVGELDAVRQKQMTATILLNNGSAVPLS